MSGPVRPQDGSAGLVTGAAGGGDVRDALPHNASLRGIAGRIAQLGGWTIELPERRLTWSDEVCDMHGMPRGHQPKLEDGVALFAPESRATIQRHLEACIREGIPYDLELEKVAADGRRVWVRSIGQAVRDAAGRIVRIEGAIQDITDRKHADALLREQAALLDKARDAIVVRDLGGRVRYWNQGAERLYGWSAAEAVGRPVTDLLYSGSGDLDAFREADAMVRATGEWTGEIEHRTMAGGTIVVEGRWTLVRDAGGRPTSVLTINTDVTGRKALEQQLLRAQRMESIGTLAGGIAHDLNNVLTPILMSIELLKRDDGPESRRATIAAIETSALKGAEMVRQVLSFARGVEGRRSDVCLRDLVADVETIANDTFLKTIRIVTDVPGDLPTVVGDSTQLHQVLLNLCVNARDAMPEGGTIAISARHQAVDARAVSAHPGVRPGPFVAIAVTDTGTGMSLEALDRLFEPFYTTKEPGKGTGLGLSTSLAIVRSHGGFFDVRSAPGAGSTFVVHLPAGGRRRLEPAERRAPAIGRGQGELILVVDDEAGIREMTRRMLEAFGYRVVVAADGAEAVAIFSRRRYEISAVLTDMMMPVMDGAAAIRIMRTIDPAVRLVTVSGLTPGPDGAVETGRIGRPPRHLPKPYTAEQLLRAIEAVLGETA